MDSLLSYQKILHDVIASTKKDEIKIRAISELTNIEMHIFNLWKQLPNLDITYGSNNTTKQEQGQNNQDQDAPFFSIEDI